MKKRLLAVLFVAMLIPMSVYAEEEPQSYKAAAGKFAAGYNNEDIKAICSLFTPELVQLLPTDRMDLMIGVLRLQLGKLQSHRFIKFENKDNAKVASYEALFEHGKLTLLVSLNEKGLIDFLWFVPDENSGDSAAMFQKIFKTAAGAKQ